MRARLLAERIARLMVHRVCLCTLIFLALIGALLFTRLSMGAAPLTADITCTSSTGGRDCDVFNISPKITAVKAQGTCEPSDARIDISLALTARPRCSGATETTNVTMTGDRGGPGIDGLAATVAGRIGITVRRQSGRSYCAEGSAIIGAVEEPNPCPPEPQPAPTPTPQQACTTPGFDGSCPEGTYPDGAGLCCSDGSCGGVGASGDTISAKSRNATHV